MPTWPAAWPPTGWPSRKAIRRPAQPLRALAFQRNGFYLAGVLPIVGVELEHAVRAVAQEARSLGADGIAHLRYDFSPASFFKFLVFPIPDWSASLSVTGMAYRLPR